MFLRVLLLIGRTLQDDSYSLDNFSLLETRVHPNAAIQISMLIGAKHDVEFIFPILKRKNGASTISVSARDSRLQDWCTSMNAWTATLECKPEQSSSICFLSDVLNEGLRVFKCLKLHQVADVSDAECDDVCVDSSDDDDFDVEDYASFSDYERVDRKRQRYSMASDPEDIGLEDKKV